MNTSTFKLHSWIWYLLKYILFVFINKLRLRGNIISFCSYLMGCYTEDGDILLEVHSDRHKRQCTEIGIFIKYNEKNLHKKRAWTLEQCWPERLGNFHLWRLWSHKDCLKIQFSFSSCVDFPKAVSGFPGK